MASDRRATAPASEPDVPEPGVPGPAAAPAIRVEVLDEAIDAGLEEQRLVAGRTDVGAVVTFTGRCRSEAGRLAALHIEHYPGMAEAELGRIAQEACRRWPLTGLSVVHRHGRIAAGETIVCVAAASAHRDAAFDAARFLMDYLKTDAPFWKREEATDGTLGPWVEAKESDEAAVRRWDRPGDARTS